MTTVAQVRAALAESLRSALPGGEGQVSAYWLSSPTPPTIVVFPQSVTYDRAMGRGHDEWEYVIQGFVAPVADIGAQELVDRMLAPSGSGSVKAAVEADPTLGGIVSDCWVREASGNELYSLPGVASGLVVGAEWVAVLMVPGS